MIPAAFDYQRASSLEDALGALAGGEAKIIAGGMSLLPLMKLRLARPTKLVDIGGIDELKRVGPTADGGFEVGALATYAEVLDVAKLPIAQECLSQIGDVQVRNRGTIGGSISHADPASDAPALALALDYSAVLRSSSGERTVPLDGFFTGAFETAIRPDEILVRIVRGPLPEGAAGSYKKMANPAFGLRDRRGRRGRGDEPAGACRTPVVAITGVGEAPYRAKAVESALMGSDGSPSAVAAAAAHVTEGQTVNGDFYADRDYRSKMAEVYTRRAIDAALGR